ncbi:MAG: FAD-binding oxidoreductase [Spongiibacteraceae bacterium]
MNQIEFEGQSFLLLEGETVLSCLLRNRQAIPHGCRAGACHACILNSDRAFAGIELAQKGLSEQQKQQQLFLSCQCSPIQNISVTKCAKPTLSQAKIIDKTWLNNSVLRLRLDTRWHWKSGQYLNIWDDDLGPRCYSIASLSRLDPYIELHIKTYQHGSLSKKLAEDYQLGEQINIEGPFGDCVYQAHHSGQDMLILSAGTGMSPMLAIARDALEQQHQGDIFFVNSAVSAQDFYYIEELEALSEKHANFHPVLCADDCHTAQSTNIKYCRSSEDYLREQQRDLRKHIVYLCGGKRFIATHSKQCFMQSARPRNIYSETFVDFSEAI